MNDMNPRAVPGGNNPPDPLDEALAPYGDFISEAETWLDGEPVTTDGQMKEVDRLTKEIKAALKAATDGQKSASAPFHDAWKAELARWKPTIEDLTRIRDGLVSIVGVFKKQKAAEAEAARRAAEAEARKAREEAERKAREAAAGDIEAQREAAAALAEAQEATKAAKNVETVKGMRLVWKYEIDNHREALKWIAANDREAITAFIEEYVRRNHKTATIDGVRAWQDKEAF